jgi:hypothetical protein
LTPQTALPVPRSCCPALCGSMPQTDRRQLKKPG